MGIQRAFALVAASFTFLAITHRTNAGTVYVSNEKSGDISVIDTQSNQVVKTIKVGKRPRGIHLDPAGKMLYVALSGSPIAGPGVKEDALPPADKKADGIGVVDLQSGKFVAKIDCGSDPEQFSLSLDGKLLYASNEDEGKATIVDLASRKIIGNIEVGYEPEGVTTSPDGKLVYVTGESSNSVHVIDTATRSVRGIINTAERPRSTAFLPDMSKAYVACETAGVINVVDVKQMKVVKSLHPQGENVRPMCVVVSPDGRHVFVSTGRGKSVLVMDSASDEVIKTIANVGARPWGIDITPDGKTLYSANGPSDDVSVIDVQSMAVTGKIKAGTSPWGVTISR